jgi:hypothetical protein
MVRNCVWIHASAVFHTTKLYLFLKLGFVSLTVMKVEQEVIRGEDLPLFRGTRRALFFGLTSDKFSNMKCKTTCYS